MKPIILFTLALAACSPDYEEIGSFSQALSHAYLTPTSDAHYPPGGVECDPSGCYNPDGYWWTGINDYGVPGSNSSGYHVPAGANDTASFVTTGWAGVNCAAITSVQSVTLRGTITTEGTVGMYVDYSPGAAPWGTARLVIDHWPANTDHAHFAYVLSSDPITGAAWSRSRLGCNVNATMPQFGYGSKDGGVWFTDLQVDVSYQ